MFSLKVTLNPIIHLLYLLKCFSISIHVCFKTHLSVNIETSLGSCEEDVIIPTFSGSM